jgi:hypothetical protein
MEDRYVRTARLGRIAACVGLLWSATATAQEKKDDGGAESRPAAATKVGVGDAIDGALKLRRLDGTDATFADYRGKPLVLVFDSIKCPYMKVAGPKLEALHAAFEKSSAATLIAVDANRGEIGKDPFADGAKPENAYASIREFLKEKKIGYAWHADHGNKLADLLSATTTPHCFVFDKDGVLRYEGALDDDPRGEKGDKTSAYVKDAVDALLKGEKPKTSSTKAYG